ncbi:MAG: serine hydrolase domain-containing protein [Chitinophagaceae bacterium]
MIKATLLTITCIIGVPGLFSQDNIKLRKILPIIDSLYKAASIKHHLPGMVYGIVYNGQLVQTGETGNSNISLQLLADSSSAFHIASMTKSFTAMAILQLRDKGKLSLDEPAYLYIPELKNQKAASPDAAPITIRHLLTHSAGFPEDNPWGDRQLAISNAQMITMIKKGISFSNPPGIAYEYSNFAYALLGYIIKKISGKYYVDYITDQVLRPLGMTNTYFEYADVADNKLAHGYRWLNNNWAEQPMLHNGAYGAMGGMITTMTDFVKYLSMHLAAWPPSSDNKNYVLKKSSLREMHHPWQLRDLDTAFAYRPGKKCPIVTAYGYGLRWSKDCEGKIMIGHSGGLPGFGSNWTFMPDYGLGVVCFANSTYAPASVINANILDTLIKLAHLSPRPIPVSPILEQRRNELIKLLPGWLNAPSSGIFAENFFHDYFTDSLKKDAMEIFQQAGKITGSTPIVAENNLRGYFILEGEKSDIKIYFTLTPETPALVQEYRIHQINKGERK